MGCVYCGKEVPLRMRLAGEERFCSPAHKQLYSEEHSRLGLERLLEEVTQPRASEPAPVPEEPPPTTPAVEKTPDDGRLGEPELVASGRGLRLWTYPRIRIVSMVKRGRLLEASDSPAAYKPSGAATEPAVAGPAKAKSSEPVAGPVAVSAAKLEPSGHLETSPVRRPSAPARPVVDPIPEPMPASKPAARKATQPPATRQPAMAKQAGESSGTEKKAARQKADAKPTEAPTFGMPGGTSDRGGSQPFDMRIAAGVVLAILLGTVGYFGFGTSQDDAGTVADNAAQPGRLEQWIPNWSDGEADENILLYGPSQEWSDYRVQWKAQGEDSVAWVFRAVDPDNYYAVRLERAADGALRLARYAIIQGSPEEVATIPLQTDHPVDESFLVELEVEGERFRLYIQGHNVADWSDGRLDRGGFGVVRPSVGFAGVDDLKVTPLGAASASSAERPHFQKGITPEHLPEVTLLRSKSPSSDESESSL